MSSVKREEKRKARTMCGRDTQRTSEVSARRRLENFLDSVASQSSFCRCLQNAACRNSSLGLSSPSRLPHLEFTDPKRHALRHRTEIFSLSIIDCCRRDNQHSRRFKINPMDVISSEFSDFLIAKGHELVHKDPSSSAELRQFFRHKDDVAKLVALPKFEAPARHMP